MTNIPIEVTNTFGHTFSLEHGAVYQIHPKHRKGSLEIAMFVSGGDDEDTGFLLMGDEEIYGLDHVEVLDCVLSVEQCLRYARGEPVVLSCYGFIHGLRPLDSLDSIKDHTNDPEITKAILLGWNTAISILGGANLLRPFFNKNRPEAENKRITLYYSALGITFERFNEILGATVHEYIVSYPHPSVIAVNADLKAALTIHSLLTARGLRSYTSIIETLEKSGGY